MRLTKTPAKYFATRSSREELAYEAVLASGRTAWSAGERVRVYRTVRGGARALDEYGHAGPDPDPRDYDVEHYVRILRDNFATRLARAFSPRTTPSCSSTRIS